MQSCLLVIVKPADTLQPWTDCVKAASTSATAQVCLGAEPLRGRFVTTIKNLATCHHAVRGHLLCRSPHCLVLLLQSLPPQPYAPLAAPLPALP